MKKIVLAMAIIFVLMLAACQTKVADYETKPEEIWNTDDSGIKPEETTNIDVNDDEGYVERASFVEARDSFKTTLTKQLSDQKTIPVPPEGVFVLDYYDSEVGKLAAYVSCDPGDEQKHPLIIWSVGGWDTSLDEFAWSYPYWENDQSASAFREAGVLMMFPSFRGVNGNPGYNESFYGEIDDIVAAYDYAAALPYVDSSRIYLGGHSTGGTRVLLASEYTDKFRAVFSLGPIDNIIDYGRNNMTFDINDEKELEMRSPINWLDDISTPTFIIEGKWGNSIAVGNIGKKTANENVYCYEIEDGDYYYADHFNIIAPVTSLLAQKILADTAENVNITITDEQLRDAMNQTPVEPMPIMLQHNNEAIGASFLLPIVWEMGTMEDQPEFVYKTPQDEDNFWEASRMLVKGYDIGSGLSLEQLAQELGDKAYKDKELEINGQTAFVWEGAITDAHEDVHFNKVAAFEVDNRMIIFDFWVPNIYEDASNTLFEQIIHSISFEFFTVQAESE